MESQNNPENEIGGTDSLGSDLAAPGVDGDIEAPVLSKGGRLRGVAALKLHLSLLFGLALCAVAFRFEISRALDGNSLSWAYVGEWPFFAGFGIYFWWFILNGRERRPKKTDQATVAPEFANMAAKWQEEQRRLLNQQLSQSDQPSDNGRSEEPHTQGPGDQESTG